jgi:hypothetical protein
VQRVTEAEAQKGNSVLLALGEGEMLFVGTRMVTFKVRRGRFVRLKKSEGGSIALHAALHEEQIKETEVVQFCVSPLCGNDLPYPVLVTNTMVVIFLCSGDTPMVVPRAVPAWAEDTTSVHWEDAAYELLLYESMDGGRSCRGEVPLTMGNIKENASDCVTLPAVPAVPAVLSRVVNPA